MKDYSKIKTMCCKSTWTRRSRAYFVCDNCGKDVTMYITLFVQADQESQELPKPD